MDKIRLDDIDKKSPFEVPEGYFNKLTSDIQERIKEKPKREWIPSAQLKWSLAGVFSIVIAAVLVFYPSDSYESAEELLAQVDDEAIMEYLDLYTETEIDLYEDLDLETDEIWLETFEPLEVDEEAIDDYLLDYDLDNLL